MHKLKSLATGSLVCFLLLLLYPVASFAAVSQEEQAAMDFLDNAFQELSEGSAPEAYLEMLTYRASIVLIEKASREGKPSDFYLKLWNARQEPSSLPSSVREYRSLLARAPQIGPNVEIINTDGLVIKPAPPIINLGSAAPAPVACSLFDVWGDGRLCNRFPSHVEAERHYDACSETVNQFLPKLDSCLNELAEIKNNQGQEPTPVPSSSPSVKCNRVGDFKDGAGKNLWKAIPDQKASCASTSVIVFQKEFTGSLGANIDILDASGKKIGSAKPKAIGPVMDDGRSVFCTDRRFSGNIFVNYSRAGSLECREVYNASQRED